MAEGIRAGVSYDWMTQSLRLTIVWDRGDGPQVARLEPTDWGTTIRWEPTDPMVEPVPTLILDRLTSGPVLEAIQRHLATVDGYVPTEARKDYLAERARVDKLEDVISKVALGLVQEAG